MKAGISTINFRTWKIREGNRLYNEGAQALSNTELLAHIIRDQSIAEKLMEHFGCLSAIADASIDELKEVNGVGDALAETIQTRQLKEAGELMQIPILDHIIVGDGRYFSCKEEGIM